MYTKWLQWYPDDISNENISNENISNENISDENILKIDISNENKSNIYQYIEIIRLGRLG
jgi:hypothetical protein